MHNIIVVKYDWSVVYLHIPMHLYCILIHTDQSSTVQYMLDPAYYA